jgi:hypothetical protein
VVRRYAECIRLLNFAIRTNQHGIVPHAASRVIGALPQFLFRLDAEGLQAATAYRDSVRDVAETAIDIGVALKRWDEVGVLTLNACLLLRLGGQENVCESADCGGKQLARILDCAKRNEYSSLLDTYFETVAAKLSTPDTCPQATEEQIYYNMAMGLGIDMTDDSDLAARLVAQGMKDINPDRVLRPCRHLFVSLGWSLILGDRLRLPTVGSKRLHCTRYEYLVEAMSLDACSRAMMETYCGKCSDADPHDAAWAWTREWQAEQNRLHARLLDEASGKAGNGRTQG